MTVPVRATYRVQLHPGFTFDHAVGVLDQLERLGVSHLYTSPVLEAVPGSAHGYDVVDPTRVRAELGGDAGLGRLVVALRARGMGWVVDIVPNHVSVEVPSANPRWWDLLAHGRRSAGAGWFDVDWAAGDGKVVLPVLGSPLADELADGTIELRDTERGVVIGYHDLEVPVAPGTASTDDVGRPERLRAILDDQHHRLSHWQAGDRNYRVFFDIDSLAALRMEDRAVFEAAHARVADWVEAGMVDGVRVDHVDGLADPAGYLRELRDLIGRDRRLWVEKILLPGEQLPSSWPVDGTTGYEFARVATALGVDPAARHRFDEAWSAAGGPADYHAVEREAKRAALRGRLGPDVRRTVDEAVAAVGADERSPVEEAVVELAVGFPVYRSYGVGDEPLDDVDAMHLAAASTQAAEFALADVAGQLADQLREPTSPAGVAFRSRFQQLTGPAMAKGAEDTAFYRYHRLTALNEVGGDPTTFGVVPSTFHELVGRRTERWPASLLLASSHDTKRSADVRARLAVLSQRPAEWFATLDELRVATAGDRPDRLDRPTEQLLWQTVVGAWPIDGDRIAAYLEKATRESGEHTEWTAVDDEYESAVTGFARHVVADPVTTLILDRFVSSIADDGRATRLAEVVLRLTAPGVPDTYQGDEDWDLSLVDPDNRRPVDHASIDRRLDEAIEIGDVDRVGPGPGSVAKLWVTHRLLSLRSERPELMPGGPYDALDVDGADDRVVAFRRGAIVVAADCRPGVGPLPDATVELPAGRWRCVLRAGHDVEGGTVSLTDLFPGVGIAVLTPAP